MLSINVIPFWLLKKGTSMSTYCKIAILVNDDANIQMLLTAFAWEYFNASRAVKIDNHRWGIDNGMNNVRAVIRNDGTIIAFCCRYQRDVQMTEDKVQRFSQAHDLQLVDLEL